MSENLEVKKGLTDLKVAKSTHKKKVHGFPFMTFFS